MDEVSKDMRADTKTTIERELAAIQKVAASNPEREVGLLAVQFYLSRLFGDCGRAMLETRGRLTNYQRFVRRLEQWRSDHREQTTYVTFNYDTMLDDALRGLAPLEHFDDYVLSHRALFKVHGSVDWAQQVEVDGGARGGNYRQLILAAPRLRRLDKWRIRADPEAVEADGALWAPAIAIPVEDKDELVMPSAHREALEDRLKRVTRVLTFGWKAQETEFMKLLKTIPIGVPVDVLTASPTGVDEAAENLRKAGLDGPRTKTASGFEQFVNGDGLPALLHRMSGAAT
jgi:hypothetical protein